MSNTIQSFYSHLEYMNDYNLERFIPCYIAEHLIGYFPRAYYHWLELHPEVFICRPDQILLHPTLDTPEKRTEEVGKIIREWIKDGKTDAVNEDYDVLREWGQQPLMKLRRGPHRLFGVLSYGVHINGYQYVDDKLHMWVGKRTKDKMTYPGRLDTFVAGGRPSGMSAREVVIKECEEEASIPPEIAKNAKAVGAISYQRQLGKTLERDTMFIYDLEIPADFTPKPNDHEVEAFYCWPIEKVMEIVRTSREFKDNCNLVVIDFLIRHGYLTPEDEVYMELVKGLRVKHE